MAITDTSERSATNGGAAKSAKRGRGVLRDPQLNHGTAFTAKERATLGLEGLLPAGVLSLEEQAKRSYDQYNAEPTNLAKNQFLAALRDRNEVLFYKLLGDHLKEMLPVIYDPVVAQARAACGLAAQTSTLVRARGPSPGGEACIRHGDARMAARARCLPDVRAAVRQKQGATRRHIDVKAQAPGSTLLSVRGPRDVTRGLARRKLASRLPQAA